MICGHFRATASQSGGVASSELSSESHVSARMSWVWASRQTSYSATVAVQPAA